MKIIELVSENIKKISVVQITPDGNLVQLAGKNGSGKTSVLDSIWWALAGAKHIQSVPIREGANEARIRLNMGEIIVTRTFKRTDGGPTTKLIVETAEGFRAGKPQEILDDLIGSLSFDPLAFCRMKARDQFDQLAQFVPGVDFDRVEAENKRDFDRRTDVARQARQARAAADVIDVPASLPATEVDISELLLRLERAGSSNAEIEKRAERRQITAGRIASLRQAANDIVGAIPAQQAELNRIAAEQANEIDREVQALQERIRKLLERSTEIVTKCEADVAALETKATDHAAECIREAEELQAKIDGAGELPAPIDTAALLAEIEAGRKTNEAIARRKARDKHVAQAEELEASAAALTQAIADRTAAKEAAIAAAELPVPGITFGDGAILLNGLPFNQASDAEQLRAAIGISMAGAPTLRVIRVRDGSLLDEDGLRLLGEMADKFDCQVWVETVRSDGKVGFVLEDGHVVSSPSKRAAQADLLGTAAE